MTRCPSCATDVPEQSRFCLSCGARVEPLEASAAATVALPPPRVSSHSSSSVDEGRFLAGTVLAERYRILGVLSMAGGALGILFAVGITNGVVALMPDFYVPNEARITAGCGSFSFFNSQGIRGGLTGVSP